MNESDLVNFGQGILQTLNNVLYSKIYDSLKLNENFKETLNPAFPFPKLTKIAILKDFFVIEYIGPEDKNSDNLNAQLIYKPQYNLYDFLDIDLQHFSVPIRIPCPDFVDNTAFFLGDSISYLCDYFYDFTQMPMEMLVMNNFYDFSNIQKPTAISNTTYFWTDANGTLKIKHIDFMEIFPITEDGVVYRDIAGVEALADFLLTYKTPKYSLKLHQTLNEFIELINLSDTTEPQITKFLEQNPEIIQMSFGTHKLNGQVTLEWQYPTTKDNLRPDFMPERMDGYCDILEFKLPRLKHSPMVGTEERYHPSSEVDVAIAQVDCYEEWCNQEINIKWLEETKKIKVFAPRRILIIGHSDDFSPEDRRKLRRIRNTTVFTYDEFIEMARFQIYRVR